VIGAFEAAIVALRSNPVPYSNAFCLLPESTAHDEVLFSSEILSTNRTGLARSLTAPVAIEDQLALLKGAESNSGYSSGAERLPESSSSGDGGDTSSDSDGKTEHPKKCMSFGEGIAQIHQHLRRATSCRPPLGRVLPPIANSPLERHIPPPPDDFLGRSLDVWKVLQYLSNRRAVVVCGADGTDHGIGKSVVLDAVHRAYTHQVGGICVASKLCSLSLPYTTAPTDGWIEKVRDSLRNAVQEVPRARRLSCSKPPNTLACKPKFQSRSGADLAWEALRGLLTELEQLVRLCEERRRNSSEGSVAGVNILLIFDECDHLIQQRHFQDSIAEILRLCPKCRVLMSTQQPMVSSAGQFKVVHHPLNGIAFPDAVRLFLRRMHRPLYWGDLTEPTNGPVAAVGVVHSLDSPIVTTKDNEAEVMHLVYRCAGVAAQRGNPQKIIALASTFGFHMGNPVGSAARESSRLHETGAAPLEGVTHCTDNTTPSLSRGDIV